MAHIRHSTLFRSGYCIQNFEKWLDSCQKLVDESTVMVNPTRTTKCQNDYCVSANRRVIDYEDVTCVDDDS